MDADRRAALLAQLAWLHELARGNIVVERWRAACLAELREIAALEVLASEKEQAA